MTGSRANSAASATPDQLIDRPGRGLGVEQAQRTDARAPVELGLGGGLLTPHLVVSLATNLVRSRFTSR